ncbi:MAG: DEAD/DEAH box helicase [Planctomycetes bacterium]|nr:DEAD/DEAH box helicase [Planctomycetota bacterium]
MRPFHPATQDWFARAFPAPTAVQIAGWARIVRAEHCLLIAPTGSGKTLAAFLWALDRCLAEAASTPGYRVLYVSPLKALAHDVERNLRRPLDGVTAVARERGEELRRPGVDLRTGDTSAAERRRMLRQPGEIMVTTPESLYLMLGSRMREHLRGVETVIVDEIHALAPTKRGAHLALSLERLETLCRRPPQRIGLSATVRPAELVASFLGGDRPVEIVDCSSPPAMDLEVRVPVADMERPDPDRLEGEADFLLARARELEGGADRPGLWPNLLVSLLATIDAHRSSIVFVNSRGLCERLARRLNDLDRARRGDGPDADATTDPDARPLVRSHHGSMSQAQRREVEGLLERGELRGLIATSSLELGIDMESVDHVVMLESPGSVARGLQRIGRAGHGVGQRSQGSLMPKHRGDLLEAAVVAAEMRAGRIEALDLPENPLDVLAQQIVATVAVADATPDELYASFRRARNFRALSRGLFDRVVDMLSGRHASVDFAELAPRLVHDREHDRLRARRGAAMLARTSGGTIPDRGLFPVQIAPTGPRVGELDEEMVYESRAGDVITLGASSWRVLEIRHDRVLVEPAGGAPGRLPFWKGDGPGRPIELGRALGAFLRRLDQDREATSIEALQAEMLLDPHAATNLLAYVDDQRRAVGALAHDRRLVVERFRDEHGDWRIVIHSPLGARVHAPWALAIESALRRRRRLDLQLLWNDDGILLRFADCSEAPGAEELIPTAGEVEELILEQLADSALYAALFRENAARALLLPRRGPGRRSALWLQRLRARSLMAATRGQPDFPIALESHRAALRDVFDLESLRRLLDDCARGRIAIHEVETPRPSPFARSLVLAFTAAWLYEGDAPAAETRARALALDPELLRELLGHEDLRQLLDAVAIDEVVAELRGLAGSRLPRDADQLHDLLRRLPFLDREEIRERVGDAIEDRLDVLFAEGRVVEFEGGDRSLLAAVENAALLRDALGLVPRRAIPEPLAARRDDALEELLLLELRSGPPRSARELAAHLGLALTPLVATLEGMVASDRATGGEFRPGGREREYSTAETLRRFRARSLARARKAIEPAAAEILALFLRAWHGLDRPGRDLEAALVRLEGLRIPLRELIDDFLPARVENLVRRDLDPPFSSGAWVWIADGGGRDTAVRLYRRERVPLLAATPTTPAAGLDVDEQAVMDALERLGAAFFSELMAILRTADRQRIEEALWRLVGHGLVSNDGLDALVGRTERARAGGRRGRGPGGRWFRVDRLWLDEPNTTERRHAQALTLLERHGILGAASCASEDLEGGFAAVLPVLRALEDAGRVRRGYFVAGLGGAQFALPGAVDRLRAAREIAAGEPARLVAVTDPAQPYGAALPWPATRSGARPRRQSGARLVAIGGRPILWAAPGGRQILIFAAADDAAITTAATLLHEGLQGRAGRRFRIETIDGERVQDAALAALFRAAGFKADLGCLSAW